MYQALYRKWRPQTFDAVLGQEHITETLKGQVMNDRLSHAYLFIGTRGTGKTTCARILARAVNCLHPVNGNPCCECEACRGILDGSILDVVELDAASNNGVDNVRALREEAVFSPTTVKKRVYIIDEVHMLSTSAFNALLKILEEPPEHLMFILATTELQKVPATILSRCQRHSFRRIDTPKIAEYLGYIAKQEGFSLTHDAAELIARLAEGGVRDALSLLDQCSGSENIDVEAVYNAMGLAGNRRTARLLSLIIKHKTEEALNEFNSMWMNGKDPVTLMGELSGLLRDALMMHVAPKGGTELVSGAYDGGTLRYFASNMTREEIMCAMETIGRTQSAMRDSKTPKVTAELCLVSLCDNTLGESIIELKARISRLEEEIAHGLTVRTQPGEVRYADNCPDEPPVPEEQEYPAPERCAEPEDDIDPEQFCEEQPEDSFIRKRETEPVSQPEPEPVQESRYTANVTWKQICEKSIPVMPVDVAFQLGNEDSVRGYIEGSVLHVEVLPGFVYGRINRQDVLSKLAAAASELCGTEIRAIISEMEQKKEEKRSIDDLYKFPEVRNI